MNLEKQLKEAGYYDEEDEDDDDSRIEATTTSSSAVPSPSNNLNKWWNNQPFKLQIHNKYGNCELCHKKSKKNLIQCIQNGTRSINWYREQESIYGNKFFRENLSIDDLIKWEKNFFSQEFGI